MFHNYCNNVFLIKKLCEENNISIKDLCILGTKKLSSENKHFFKKKLYDDFFHHGAQLHQQSVSH